MDEIIKILHLEDVATDAAIVARKLKTAAFVFKIKVVNTEKDFKRGLDQFSPDVILCDHALPEFNSIEALKIVKEKGLRIPFILVTGAVGEEFAASIVLAGADDYVLKDRLTRLPTAILNCVIKHRSERERKEIEEGFRLTFKALKDYAFFQLDILGNVRSCNSAAENIKGFLGDEMIGKSTAQFYTEEDQQKGIPEFNLRMAREKGEYNHIGWRKKNDGTLYYADVVITALYDENGHFRGYSKIARDITERKLVEQRLIQSEEKYRKIVHTSQEGIWTVDENHIVTFVNDKICEMFEYASEEMIGKPNTFFIDKEHKKQVSEAIERRKMGISESYEVTFVAKSGKRLWTNVSASPIFEHGIYRGALAMVTDITARKHAEEETLSLVERLQVKNKDLSQFAYMVSHNLRAPIAKILGLASILKHSHETAMILNNIVEETVNLDNVVKDMNTIITARDVSQEKAEHVIFIEELKLIERVLEHQITESNAVITTNFRTSGILTVKGRFYSILYNLISNALKYRSPFTRAQIHVETEDLRDCICLSVRDNGMGIDLKKHGDKMFMLYKRFHNVNIPGKGVGLNLVKTQVESLSGRIEVISEVNAGSTFKIYFPKTYKSKIRSNISRLFLIDDDKLCNAINKKVLLKQIALAKIDIFESAQNALNELQHIVETKEEEFPDLIFLDLNMPEMDGWQFLLSFEKLKGLSPEKCKVVILSSSINKNEIERSKNFKTVHRFISKPLTPEKILDLVAE